MPADRHTTAQFGATYRRLADARRVPPNGSYPCNAEYRPLECPRCSDTTLASSTPSRVSALDERIDASSAVCRPVASRGPVPMWMARCIEHESSE